MYEKPPELRRGSALWGVIKGCEMRLDALLKGIIQLLCGVKKSHVGLYTKIKRNLGDHNCIWEVHKMLRKCTLLMFVGLFALMTVCAAMGAEEADGPLEQAAKLFEEKKYDEAEKAYLDIAGQDTADAMIAQQQLVLLYIVKEEPTKADTAYQQLLGRFSGREGIAKCIWEVARGYMKAGDNEKSLEINRYNVKSYSKNKYAMWSQVEVVYSYIKAADEAGADAEYSKLIEGFSEQETLPKEIYQVAMQYRKLGNMSKVIALHKYNVENYPDYNDVYVMWSQAEIVKYQIRKGDNIGSQEEYNTLVTTFSEQETLPREIYRIGDEYVKAGQYDEAGKVYQSVLEKWAGTEYELPAKMGIVKLDIALGQEVPEARIEGLIAEYKDNSMLTESLASLGEAFWEQACKRRRHRDYVMAKAFYNRSLSEYERIVNDYPESREAAKANYFAGGCNLRLEMYEKALDYFNTVLEKWPNFQYNWSAQCLIGSCYERLRKAGAISPEEGDSKMAAAYRAVVEKYPDCSEVPIACIKLGELSIEQGSPHQAREYFKLFMEKARANDPRRAKVAVYLNRMGGI